MDNNNSRDTQEPFLLNPSRLTYDALSPEKHTIDLSPSLGEIHPLATQKSFNPFEASDQDLEKSDSVPFSKIFMYATPLDILYMILGTIASIGNGLVFPAYSVIFGKMTNSIGPEASSLMESAKTYSILYLIVGAVGMVLSGIGLTCWMLTGERQNICFRREYFRALLRQDISFYDSINPNELTTKIANDTTAIQSAIGEKISSLFYVISMCIAGYAVGFYWNWKLTLILTSTVPPMMFSGGFFGWSVQKGTEEINKSYEKSGGYAEQALNAIRTVVSLTAEKKEHDNYVHYLLHTKATAIKWGVLMGVGLGFLFFCIFAEYALGMWYGSVLISESNEIKTGDVLVVFFSVSTGTMSLGQLTPVIKAYAEGKKALQRVAWLIERKPQINIEEMKGKTLKNDFTAEIRFEKVSFSYPLREKITILDDIDIVFESGKKTALVGESGCGKSTCLQLLERFYDPNLGKVIIDGIDITELQLASLRHHIGYVGQEPVLFGTSIIENLRFGKKNASEAEIIEASKQANAYEFIMKLEKKFETFVGPGGTQLSGGQKQRLAIARAILKNPKILLLDEATSALDRKNEMEIQKTLDHISQGRTTIVIAHRLTTIRNADKIIVIENGKAVEQGTHEELLQMKGAYLKIQKNQMIVKEEEEKEIEEDNDVDKKDKISSWDEKPLLMKKLSSVKKETNILDEIRLTMKKVNSISQVKEVELEEEHKKKLEKKYTDSNIFRRLYSNFTPEIIMIFAVTSIFSVLNGSILPTFAILFAEMLEVLNMPWAPDYNSRCSFLAWMFLLIALLSFFFRVISFWSSFVAAERLSHDLRSRLYGKMLSMHIGWFDLPINSAGTLATKLQADVQLVNGLTSSILGIIIEAAASLVVGVVIAFIYSWQLTLAIILTTPLILFCGKVQEEMNTGFSAENDKAYKESAGMITEAVTNMRTVCSFGNDNKLLDLYDRSLVNPKRIIVKKSISSGIIYGCSIFITFAIYALSYFVGILFLERGEVDFKHLYCSIYALMFAAFGSGSASQYMPDVGKAKNAARGIYEILDEEPKITNNEKAITKNFDDIQGNIEFKDISFKYPTRDHQIFQHFNLSIQAGTKVAFVGSSGCGKSTIISLLMRFYEVQEGQILLDGVNIKDYDLTFLRRCFGIVSQEPVLFNGTIDYNIKYVREDADKEEVREAAKAANALEFIEKNQFEVAPTEENNANYGKGFERMVGPKGSQISGGQKQRIAIARAIINKPKILLLDEATSALDSKNEEVVQQSLDNIMKGYTSITIAHRLSTVKDADLIYVFDDGKIAEKGTFELLMEKKGLFWALAEGIAHQS